MSHTPQSFGSTLIAAVGVERVLRLVLDEVSTLAGRRFDESATVDELLSATAVAGVELSAVVAEAENRLAREAVEVCPGCSHKLHAFDVCSCGCDDQVGARRVEVEAAQR